MHLPMNTDPAPLQPFLDAILPAVLHALWTLLWSPAGLILVGLLALRVLIALAVRIKRDFDRFMRMG